MTAEHSTWLAEEDDGTVTAPCERGGIVTPLDCLLAVVRGLRPT